MQRIIGKCPCGGFLTIHALFVGEEHNLVLEGQCLECMERVISSVKLTQLYKMAMEERKGKPLRPPVAEKPEHTDHEWFKLFGIKESE